MGLLRLMGNKADVVKGLAKRCNENWRVAPTSDIVRLIHLQILASLTRLVPGALSLRYPRPLDHDDPEFKPLRKDSFSFSLQLPRPNLNRDDRREQPDQRRLVEVDRAGYGAHPHELGHRSLGYERPCARPRRSGECKELYGQRAFLILSIQGYGWFSAIIACLAAIAVIGGWSTYKLMTR